MRQAILDGALLQSHCKAGLKLVEKGNWLCMESTSGKALCWFPLNTTVEQIRKVANIWMNETDMVSFVR